MGLIAHPLMAAESKPDLSLYGTLRPTLEFIEEDASNGADDDSTIDVQDALSRIGLTGSLEIEPGVRGFFEGEWSVDMGDNGDFGRSRRANVGLRWQDHQIWLGKGRPPQYTLIAEAVDIFNHRSAPFAYDQVSPFFTDNMLSYRYKDDSVHFELAGQFNGRQGDDRVDMFNGGLGVDFGSIDVAASFMNVTAADGNVEGEENTFVSGRIVYDKDDIYVALAYQDIDTDLVNGVELSGDTLDFSVAYALGQGYKLKLGFFDYDDGLTGAGSRRHDGYNVTLERQFTNLRLHIELLGRNYDFREDSTILSIGIRYDFTLNFADNLD